MPETRLQIALRPRVIRRGLMYAAIVGPILIAINHYDAILAGDLEPMRVMKMCLTLAVPYLVSTFSSVAAIRTMQHSQPAS